MTWSIRARLTTWYSVVVVTVLAAGAIAVGVVQQRLALKRMDGEIQRLMLTLEGVMRTEIGEGLTLQASADEASVEVVAPDRALVLTRPDGTLLAMWGHPFPRDWRPPAAAPALETIVVGSERLRLFSRPITHGGHSYVAAVLAPLDVLEAEHRELIVALAIGVLTALAVAVAGGWLVARQTLKPLTDMAAQLATSLHGQRQFMADASHELRTPVSVVRTTAQVTLARATRPEDDYRESLTIVAEQSERLARLVDSMFLLSRAEAQGIPLHREHLYLDDLVEECARALRVVAAERGVSVQTSGDAEVAFDGDNILLRQMIGNLLENAIRHARSGGSVAATVTKSSAHMTVRVTDDGGGVPVHEQERIFQRFVRLDSRSGGAGLGLPIARWIAEAHGGRLVLESSGANGSCFSVTLPV